mmetsp:Transcript_19877/g.35454  ORF Transcript_19877/g.35454 Transcript_19877/m.35454 type:complete len:84 (+) Transcript_19877:60-311(+)
MPVQAFLYEIWDSGLPIGDPDMTYMMKIQLTAFRPDVQLIYEQIFIHNMWLHALVLACLAAAPPPPPVRCPEREGVRDGLRGL